MPFSDISKEISVASFLQADDDAASSLCDGPSLPGGVNRVKFLADSSEGEKTGDDSSQVGCPALYGEIPVGSQSGSEGGDETDANSFSANRPGPSRTTAHPQEETQRELSGRSRAILKQYFDEAEPFSFSMRHQSVAFSESQVYHLLRFLSDEALNMSCSAMERMVIGAVKGTLATASSRTEHFKTRTRVETPKHRRHSDSSSGEFVTDPDSGSETVAEIDLERETEDLDSFNGCDRSDEMALFTESFKRSTAQCLVQTAQEEPRPESSGEGSESAGHSSLDATLSEVRDHTSRTEIPQ